MPPVVVNNDNSPADGQSQSSPDNFCCLGTRMVVLTGALSLSSSSDNNNSKKKDRLLPTQGLLVVHQQQRQQGDETFSSSTTSSTSSALSYTLSICTGNDVFTSKILDVSDIRVTQDYKDKIPTCFLQDNNEHPTIQITFEYEIDHVDTVDNVDNDVDDVSICVIVKQRLSTGHLKSAFSGYLQRNNDNDSNKSSSVVLGFVQSIGDSYNSIMKQTEHTNIELKQVKESMNQWKDTSLKLEQNWQIEKDQLLQNFVVLLNEVREKSNAQIHQLKEQLQNLHQGKTNNTWGSKRGIEEYDYYDDAPDDLDQRNKNNEPIDMDVAMAYATGERISSNKNSNSRPKRDPILDPHEAEQNLNKYRNKKVAVVAVANKRRKVAQKKSTVFDDSSSEDEEDEEKKKRRRRNLLKSSDDMDDQELTEPLLDSRKPSPTTTKQKETPPSPPPPPASSWMAKYAAELCDSSSSDTDVENNKKALKGGEDGAKKMSNSDENNNLVQTKVQSSDSDTE